MQFNFVILCAFIWVVPIGRYFIEADRLVERLSFFHAGDGIQTQVRISHHCCLLQNCLNEASADPLSPNTRGDVESLHFTNTVSQFVHRNTSGQFPITISKAKVSVRSRIFPGKIVLSPHENPQVQDHSFASQHTPGTELLLEPRDLRFPLSVV